MDQDRFTGTEGTRSAQNASAKNCSDPQEDGGCNETESFQPGRFAKFADLGGGGSFGLVMGDRAGRFQPALKLAAWTQGGTAVVPRNGGTDQSCQVARCRSLVGRRLCHAMDRSVYGNCRHAYLSLCSRFEHVGIPRSLRLFGAQHDHVCTKLLELLRKTRCIIR